MERVTKKEFIRDPVFGVYDVPGKVKVRELVAEMTAHSADRQEFTGAGKKAGIFPLYYEVPPIPSGSDRLHDHEYFEIILVIHGRGQHRTEMGVSPLAPGDVVFVNPRLPHCVETEAGFGRLNIAFKAAAVIGLQGIEKRESELSMYDILEFFYPLQRGYNFILSISGNARTRIFAAAFELVSGFYQGHVAKTGITLRFNTVLHLLYEEYRQLYPKAGTKAVWLTRVLDYLKGNFTHQVSLRKIASLAGLTDTYFMREFKRLTGRKLTSYVNVLRVTSAGQLLRNSTLSVMEIAQASGFNELAHFNHTFKKETGYTPTSWRKGQKS